MNQKLYDEQIRLALVKMLQTNKYNTIIEELHILNGNAIADVVALNNELHCYEIKSDVDNIKRIEQQGKYFDLVFSKITLVTTTKHLKNALKIIPDHWGLIVAEEKRNEIVFKYHKKIKYNKNFNKELSLSILWKNEMLKLGEYKDKIRKDELAKIIAKDFSRSNLLCNLSNSLKIRKNNHL